jgi:hypothetical protein
VARPDEMQIGGAGGHGSQKSGKATRRNNMRL